MSEDKHIGPDGKREPVTEDEQNVPISRFSQVVSERNDLRAELESLKSREEDAKKAKLAEEEKWQELNATLMREIDDYKPYKAKWEEMDAKIRESALEKLPEDKREKYSKLDTSVLLDIADDLSVEKPNPPDNAGTIPKDKLGSVHDMKPEERKKNWSAILDSYRR